MRSAIYYGDDGEPRIRDCYTHELSGGYDWCNTHECAFQHESCDGHEADAKLIAEMKRNDAAKGSEGENE